MKTLLIAYERYMQYRNEGEFSKCSRQRKAPMHPFATTMERLCTILLLFSLLRQFTVSHACKMTEE
ncbi:uncharacterized protein PHALS_15355 [Plasmopara halstedii]|uniref:Uncharacterized protein n=1 Tax=Plasmopara halstedii TaxID=4781 RepID=A0A0N7L4M5_PLAHL|nr:uncharacterized protein PHALS_15355 [Plasmopara halstedii]CEG39091.1 hypothetical protein PHALS_15355 [Plasmopara halstedii]|eukprot:XP_024575460.1 hypothetical protein PHALS_15355 [Plasmopara halstedii]